MEQLSATSQLEPEPELQQSIILLAESNCQDIKPHLMTGTNKAVEMVWAPTIQDARNWTTANGDEIGDRIVILLVGTNDLKNQKDKNEVSTMQKEVTQAISETRAQLIVAQLPPVYHPQPRAESRHRHRADQWNSARTARPDNHPRRQDHPTPQTNGKRRAPSDERVCRNHGWTNNRGHQQEWTTNSQ